MWRLCQDLAECMDGRVWPAKDKDKVLMLLMHEAANLRAAGAAPRG